MKTEGAYQQVINEFVKPQMHSYKEMDVPDDDKFKGVDTTRSDFDILNIDKNKLSYCIFHEKAKLDELRDYVIYCHAREGNKLQGLFLRSQFLPEVNVVLFDFIGCGNSQGTCVTLGVKESYDIGLIIAHIKENRKPKSITLWGRSMGAVSSILYAENSQYEKLLKCLILDSPFLTIDKLAEDVTKNQQYVPSFLINCGMCCVKKDLEEQTGSKLGSIDTRESVRKINIPAVYISAKEDKVVLPKRIQTLCQLHFCPKKAFISTQGGHADERDERVIETCVKFIKEILNK